MTIPDEDVLIMDDDIKDRLGINESDIELLEDGILIGSLDLHIGEKLKKLIIGPVVGICIEKINDANAIKLDVRIQTFEAYEVLTCFAAGDKVKCNSYFLTLGNEEKHIAGPWIANTVRVTDFDKARKMCTLALDLFEADIINAPVK